MIVCLLAAFAMFAFLIDVCYLYVRLIVLPCIFGLCAFDFGGF